jgi:drug/metabolite transporter (DMT)-like permease
MPIPASTSALQSRAALMLVVTTFAWGISFPLGKGAMMAQQAVAPAATSVALAASLLAVRFAISLLPQLLALRGPGARATTRAEWSQGLGIGLFGGLGILVQTDGLAHTSASTAAFLTQGYCVWIPLFLAMRHRRMPGLRVLAAVALVMAGVYVLSGARLGELHIGRGELEVLISSFLFAGQILWLDRPRYAGNRMGRVSAVMFGAVALLSAAGAVAATRGDPRILLAPLATPALAGATLVLAVVCTWIPFSLMNRWQPHLDATRAGLIYCAEPVFGSLFALCLPAWISPLLQIAYANESPGLSLLAGGAAILVANILALPPAAPRTPPPA